LWLFLPKNFPNLEKQAASQKQATRHTFYNYRPSAFIIPRTSRQRKLYAFQAAILTANAINFKPHAARAEFHPLGFGAPIFVANWADSFNSILLKFFVV